MKALLMFSPRAAPLQIRSGCRIDSRSREVVFAADEPRYVKFGRCLLLLLRIRSAHLKILVFPMGGGGVSTNTAYRF